MQASQQGGKRSSQPSSKKVCTMAGAGKRRDASLLREVGQVGSLQTFTTFSVVSAGINMSSVSLFFTVWQSYQIAEKYFFFFFIA